MYKNTLICDIIYIEVVSRRRLKQMNRVRYWIDLAKYDLETAKAMNLTKRYLYVGFMCHQVMEKVLKAYYVK